MGETCAVLGQPDADFYEQAARHFAIQLAGAYYNPETHQFSNGSQTAQAIALHFGFVSEETRGKIHQRFVQDIEQAGYLDAGILGAKFVLRALSEGGHSDRAFRLVTRTEIPSWGYWMKMGATTLWEDWRGTMSRNHIMFGDVSAWFHEWILGIQQAPLRLRSDPFVCPPSL